MKSFVKGLFSVTASQAGKQVALAVITALVAASATAFINKKRADKNG
ncbi:MAG: hypothetical protein QM500_04180 [Methylococcales bacterium]